MANLSQQKRQRMLEFLQTIREEHKDDDDVLIAIGEIESELNARIRKSTYLQMGSIILSLNNYLYLKRFFFLLQHGLIHLDTLQMSMV